MDFSNLKPLNIDEFRARNSKTLYRSICVPSSTQSYSLCIEFMKRWFLSKFPENTFKSIYVEGKNIYDDYRTLDKTALLKRDKPALTITPDLNWDFNNENIDTYPYGMDLYTQTGRLKQSFFSYPQNNSYLGIGMETILMNFNYKIKLETRAQQLDMYKFIKLACRVGFTCGEDVDLDFHVPYALMLQLARDNGFATSTKSINGEEVEVILDVPTFLRWINRYSTIPFLYKFRALNGRNEFFIKMRNMYVHIRPGDLSADNGEREGQLTNNFMIELSAEVRFPVPKMYAYYSDNSHKLQTIYGAWYQPNDIITACYTFKGSIIKDENNYGWPLLLSTTYEEDDDSKLNDNLVIELNDLLEGDIGECIQDCLGKSISPSIFCQFVFYNGGEYIDGKIDWENRVFTSSNPVRSLATYIGIYVDNNFVNNYILRNNERSSTRITESK